LQEFLDKNSKTLKSPEELQKVFTDNNVNLDVLNIRLPVEVVSLHAGLH
jgi:hypothetical protein